LFIFQHEFGIQEGFLFKFESGWTLMLSTFVECTGPSFRNTEPPPPVRGLTEDVMEKSRPSALRYVGR
jgi:hypothetical protein